MEGEGGERKSRGRKIVTVVGSAAFLAVAVNISIFVFNSHKQSRKKRDLKGSNVRLNLSASEIRKLANHIIAKSKEVHDSLAILPLDKVTYQNVMSLAEFEAQYFPLVQSCIFPRFLSTSEEVRKASVEAERCLDAHASLCRKREDVFRVVKAFATKGEYVSMESKLFIQTLVREYENNGLNLTATKGAEVQRLRDKIDDLSLQYIYNLNNERTSVLLTEVELDGLPSEFFQQLEKAEDGKYHVTLRSNHVSAVLELCKVGSTRRKVAVAYGQRCKKVNVPILEHLVQLRHKLARLLGYENYADYAVSSRMTKSSSKVINFLEDLSTSLSDLAAKELAELTQLKLKEEGDSPFGIEDLLYYVKRNEEHKFDIDFADLKQYFPHNLVLLGILKTFQDLLGLRFDEITDPEVWHQDVRLFSVSDMSTSELLGYAYLDLFAREGKYSCSCVVPLQNGSLLSNGGRQVSIVLLIAGFHKEAGGQPGLLRFSELVNLFHEFGHVVHHICNRASLARFSGLRVNPDFVEIPGHVFENWCYESCILKLISGFHQDITRPINDDICMSLKIWHHSSSILKLRQEILYCLFDQIIHSEENVDFLELFKFLHSKMMMGLPVLDGTDPSSCFPHSAIGYESVCYTRIWSKVFAADLFASKFGNDLTNQYVGMQFRSKVLAPGGAKDPVEALSDFLGREPSIQAFVDSLDLSNS
ncbi:hypothetical protein V2J09_013184 [Rumex salicifolius]